MIKRALSTKRQLCWLLAGILVSTGALAQPDHRMSLDQAVEQALGRFPGRVLSAETQRQGGRESHRIRILTDDGRVKRLRIDAESGRFERRGGR